MTSAGDTRKRRGSMFPPWLSGALISLNGRRETLGGCGVAAHAVDEQPEEAVGELLRVPTLLEPGVRPVGGREEEQCGRALVEIGAQLALLAALAEERSDPLFVAPALGHKGFSLLV